LAAIAKPAVPPGNFDYNRSAIWNLDLCLAGGAGRGDRRHIAYDAHDIDDGLRAGLYAVDDLKVMPLTAEIIAVIDRHYPASTTSGAAPNLVRELISHLIGAVVSEAGQAVDIAQPQSADDVAIMAIN